MEQRIAQCSDGSKTSPGLTVSYESQLLKVPASGRSQELCGIRTCFAIIISIRSKIFAVRFLILTATPYTAYLPRANNGVLS